MKKIIVNLKNKRTGESARYRLEFPSYWDEDEYIQDWIYKQFESWSRDDFFDDCYISDISYTWTYCFY